MKTSKSTLVSHLQISNSKHRTSFFYFLIVYISCIFLFFGCSDVCETEQEFTYYTPIYKTLEEVRSSVKQEAPRDLEKLGKLYLKSGYLYLNEPNKGLHVIDNTNPRQPQKISFINIPGNSGLSAKGNYLYVDSFTDLVVLDISDPNNIKETTRLNNVFENKTQLGFKRYDPKRGFLTGWKKERIVKLKTSDCEQPKNRLPDCPNCFTFSKGVLSTDATSATFEKNATANTGIGGSLATFTIYDNFLYTLEQNRNLILVDITNVSDPKLHSKRYIGWGIETLFPYRDKLFMGANNGMYIYDLKKPSSPTLITMYSHVRSCDPVVVQGKYAYVTLRSGNRCRRGVNRLEVINISNLARPKLEKAYQMYNPHGLGIDRNTLFICDGTAGLKIYDASDINTINTNMKANYKNIHSLDVIPYNNVLMMIGKDGLFQYDYSDINNIVLLSKIEAIKR